MRKWISSQINRQHYYDGSLWGCVDTNFSRNYFLFTALAFYSIFYFDYYIYLCAMHSGLLSTLTKSIGNSIFTSKREYLCTLLFVDSIRQEKHFRYLAFVVIHNSFVCTFCERTLTHTHGEYERKNHREVATGDKFRLNRLDSINDNQGKFIEPIFFCAQQLKEATTKKTKTLFRWS